MRNFTIQELTASTTTEAKKINNDPTPEVLENLKQLINNVLDPLRNAYGKPIIVTSGYRSPALNAAVKGSKTSQHMKGQAADMHRILLLPARTRIFYPPPLTRRCPTR